VVTRKRFKFKRMAENITERIHFCLFKVFFGCIGDDDSVVFNKSRKFDGIVGVFFPMYTSCARFVHWNKCM
jgi:hypothetical protein